MAKHTVEELDKGQLDLMWNFLKMGAKYRPNIAALKELCGQLRQAMVQKTGGQRKEDPKVYVKLDDVGTLVNCIVCETMSLYLSGELDKLERSEPK